MMLASIFTPAVLPSEFSPATEAMVERLGAMLVAPLRQAWEPLAKLEFVPARPEASAAMLPGFDGDDAMIVTRFGIAAGTAAPVFIDGKKEMTLRGANIADEFQAIVEDYIAKRYGDSGTSKAAE